LQIRRIVTIFRKDLRDAIRDARVLVALIVPMGIGIFYSFTFTNESGTVTAKVAIYSPSPTSLTDDLLAVGGTAVAMAFYGAGSPDAVQAEVKHKHADLGLILPSGFDAAIKAGRQPTIQVIQRASPTYAGDYVQAALEPALRLMAGQSPPATYDVVKAAKPAESETALDKVGLRNWSILASIVTMIGMIALLAVPVILAEENEKKTLDALVLVASYPEVVIAKAAVGLFYIAVMVPLLLAITTTSPVKPPLFVAAIALLSVSLIGFGLLLAGLFKSASQLNTWSGMMLLPVVAPAFIIGLPAPDALTKVASALPAGSATKILMNGMSDRVVFGNDALAFAIIAAWGLLAYALLLWQLSRRQA
jgi:hypothetical protein